MKSIFRTKTLIALAAAVAAASTAVNQAQGQPVPSPQAEAVMPSDIVPGSPLAEVIKMLRAGVDANTIKSYIFNCQNSFNLDADKIAFLRDMGVTSDLINALMDRDKVLYAASVTPPTAQATVAVPAPDVAVAPAPPDAAMAPPAAEITADYFNGALSPYGSWVEVEGYGRCWRPTAVNYNTAWSPYCDNGHWVYTEYGWYWDSDYSWGVTFHYGRWFRNPRFGWCWYPDTVWAPSWVAWRSGGEYCGWAPLPPFAEFRAGGFFYRGASVAVDFDFGLGADCFVFMSPEHFCDRHPRSFFVPHERVINVYHQTTIINHYSVVNNTIVNHGFGPDRIAAATHHPIEVVHVGSLANAGSQGWRGAGYGHTQGSAGFGNNAGHNGGSAGHTGGVDPGYSHTGQSEGQGGHPGGTAGSMGTGGHPGGMAGGMGAEGHPGGTAGGMGAGGHPGGMAGGMGAEGHPGGTAGGIGAEGHPGGFTGSQGSGLSGHPGGFTGSQGSDPSGRPGGFTGGGTAGNSGIPGGRPGGFTGGGTAGNNSIPGGRPGGFTGGGTAGNNESAGGHPGGFTPNGNASQGHTIAPSTGSGNAQLQGQAHNAGSANNAANNGQNNNSKKDPNK